MCSAQTRPSNWDATTGHQTRPPNHQTTGQPSTPSYSFHLSTLRSRDVDQLDQFKCRFSEMPAYQTSISSQLEVHHQDIPGPIERTSTGSAPTVERTGGLSVQPLSPPRLSRDQHQPARDTGPNFRAQCRDI